ncbi:MAG: arsenite efflux transporter metallochaperone ArsD [Desulfitobacterium hafniense]|nr:arsenite efflux transporter metallochaperone ArsD [Desulfitobacterium hafniense]
MKLEFFEPAMCCSTGLCGPAPDERMVRLNENIQLLKGNYPELQIERYMISQQPLKFRDNPEVYALVREQGQAILPITTFKGKVIKSGDYLELTEIERIIQEEGRA